MPLVLVGLIELAPPKYTVSRIMEREHNDIQSVLKGWHSDFYDMKFIVIHLARSNGLTVVTLNTRYGTLRREES